MPHGFGPLPDGLKMGLEGRIGPSTAAAISHGKRHVQVLATGAKGGSRGERCSSALSSQSRGRDAKGALPVRRASCPASADQLFRADAN